MQQVRSVGFPLSRGLSGRLAAPFKNLLWKRAQQKDPMAHIFLEVTQRGLYSVSRQLLPQNSQVQRVHHFQFAKDCEPSARRRRSLPECDVSAESPACASLDTPFPLALLGPQAPVNLPSADAQKLLLPRRGHPVALANPGHPVRQQPSVAPTRDVPQLPKSPPAPRALAGHSAVGVHAAVAPVAFREELNSKDESRISGGNRCSGKIRSASFASLPAPPCDRAHTLPKNIRTSPCVPIQPLLKFSVESGYILRLSTASLGLHLAWLDTRSRILV
jgi:hypothetical protein